MKTLHILKSEPDENTRVFLDILAEGENTTPFPLYEKDADYDRLIELIFENDRTVSWW